MGLSVDNWSGVGWWSLISGGRDFQRYKKQRVCVVATGGELSGIQAGEKIERISDLGFRIANFVKVADSKSGGRSSLNEIRNPHSEIPNPKFLLKRIGQQAFVIHFKDSNS